MKASHKGHVDIVRILIIAKAQVNTREEVCRYSYGVSGSKSIQLIAENVSVYMYMWYYHCYHQVPLMGIWF